MTWRPNIEELLRLAEIASYEITKQSEYIIILESKKLGLYTKITLQGLPVTDEWRPHFDANQFEQVIKGILDRSTDIYFHFDPCKIVSYTFHDLCQNVEIDKRVPFESYKAEALKTILMLLDEELLKND